MCLIAISLVGCIQPKADEAGPVLSYEDNGRQLFPMQVSVEGKTEITRCVPRRNGYVFGGWKKGKEDDVFLPGDEIFFEKDTVLEPVWNIGVLNEPKLAVRSEKDGRVVFALDFSFGGFASYNSYEVYTENLTTGEQNIFVFGNDEKELCTRSLDAGAYKAYLLAEKYGVTYKSPMVYFVAMSGEILENEPLKLVLDGELQVFNQPPLLIENHTYIGLRQFCESMGAKVEWRNEDRSAAITLDGNFVRVFENSGECIVNGMNTVLATEVKISNSTMYIPLRNIAELCGCTIIWDDNRTVYVFKDNEKRLSENLFYMETENGNFLSYSNNGLYLSDSPDFNSVWFFETVDRLNGIYEIYNLNAATSPLQTETTQIFDGQKLRITEKNDYDGYLWRISGSLKDGVEIKAANNSKLFLDADGICLGTEMKKIRMLSVDSL